MSPVSLVGIARMDDQRQAGLARRGDVGAEALGLLVARAVLVVEVEAGLADADDLGMARRLDQAVRRASAPPPSPRADGRRPSTRRCRGARRWRAPCRTGRAACRWSACPPRRRVRARASTPASSLGELGKVEMAVAVDQHQAGSLRGSTKRGNTPCGLGSAVPGTSSRVEGGERPRLRRHGELIEDLAPPSRA